MRHLRTLAALATVASISMPLHAAAAISAQQLNNTFQQDTLAGQWAGGDAAITIPGPSHNTWWLFGDTITETHPDYFQWTPSSALLINNSDPGNTQPVTHFDGDTPIPSLLPSTGGTKFWPSSTAPHPRHSGCRCRRKDCWSPRPSTRRGWQRPRPKPPSAGTSRSARPNWPKWARSPTGGRSAMRPIPA